MASGYLTMERHVRPMPLHVPSEVMVSEWKRCWEDKKIDSSHLFKLLDPFIDNWEAMLRGAQKKDINYVSLCGLIAPRNPTLALEMIANFVTVADDTSSVHDELTMLLVERLRRRRYWPSQASPIMAEYVLALDFKLFLRHKIVSSQVIRLREATIMCDGEDPDTISIEQNIPDYLAMKNIITSPWEDYLIGLMVLGMKYGEVARVAGISESKCRLQEIDICLKLKTILSES